MIVSGSGWGKAVRNVAGIGLEKLVDLDYLRARPERHRRPSVIWTILRFLQSNLVWSIPVSMVGGLVVGATVDPRPLKALILPVTILMIYPIMVTLDVRRSVAGCCRATKLWSWSSAPPCETSRWRWPWP